MKPRDYQEHAIESLFEYFQEYDGNPVLALPPGTGKSVVIGAFVKQVYSLYPCQRIMMVTHVKELIVQNFEKLMTMWPTAPAGVYSAGLGRKDITQSIIYGGIASVSKKPELFGHIDLIIIDECHLVSQKQNTLYQKFITALTEVNPALKVIGLTATAYRMGQGGITEEGGLFTDMCCDMTTLDTFNWFFDEGYLCKLIPKRPRAVLNVDGVHVRGGEFIAKELQNAVDQYDITHAAIEELLEWGHDRKHCLIFAAGITHAEHIVEILEEFGITAASVHSKMPIKERDRIIKAFENGEYWALVNNGILTTGYDFPAIDLLGILRPTKSTALWIQILGRGIRTDYATGYNLETREGRLDAIANSSKPDCLVMDFAGNAVRLGPINNPVIPQKRGKKKGPTDPVVKMCVVCRTENPPSTRFCNDCGNEFPPPKLNIDQMAGDEELIDKGDKPEIQVEVFKVDRVIYHRHNKKGKPLAIKVTYYCGLRRFSEYVCLEHGKYAAKKARTWWRDRGAIEVPETTEEALQQIEGLPTPTHIRVWVNKKYPEVLASDYTGTAFEAA